MGRRCNNIPHVYKYVQTCTNMYKYVQTCTNMYKYVQICTNMYIVQICTNMHKHVQTCTIIIVQCTGITTVPIQEVVLSTPYMYCVHTSVIIITFPYFPVNISNCNIRRRGMSLYGAHLNKFSGRHFKQQKHNTFQRTAFA